MNRKYLIVVVAITLIFIIAASLLILSNSTNLAESQKTIKIGWISALTGPVASYGVPALNGAKIAVDEINEKGGINGKLIELVVEDGKCDSKEALSAAQKLIQTDNVKVILGGHCTPETLGAAPVAEQNKVILLASVTTSPDVTKAGDYIFRTSPLSTAQAKLIAEYAYKNLELRKIAIVTEQTAYARPIAVSLRKEFENIGGNIVSFEEFPTTENDFTDIVTKIKTNNPDSIFISPQSHQKSDLIIRKLEEFGVKAQLFGNDVAGGNIAIQAYGKAGEGLIFGEPRFDKNEKWQDLEKKYKEKYNVDEVPYEIWTADSYDGVNLIAEGLKKCGEKTDCIKEYLYHVKDWEGASGTISIDENGDGIKPYVLKQVINGKAIEIG